MRWHCSPILSTPLTDLSYVFTSDTYKFNFSPLCNRLELKFLDCLEAYGLRKGSEKCAAVLYDLSECNYGHYQKLRVEAIQNERMRQFRAGKLAKPFEEHPPLDSYMYI